MKLPHRRQFLHLAAGAAALPTASCFAQAQTYPTRPITMIVPFDAGGLFDKIGRVLAERMRGSLGQPVVIENVSGANGRIGIGQAARANPDGYTICLGIKGTHVLNGALYSLPYDVLNDFMPISALTRDSIGLFGRKTLPANDLTELIAWLRATPDKAAAGFTVVATLLVAKIFQKETGTQFALTPYGGNPYPELARLVAGQIDLLFVGGVQPALVRAGGIKAFAVTSDTRLTVAPEIPTFSELGLPTLSYLGWSAIFAPTGTPRDIIGKLNVATVEALADPTAWSWLADIGFEVFPREQQTPEALAAMRKADAEKWWPVIKELGIKAE